MEVLLTIPIIYFVSIIVLIFSISLTRVLSGDTMEEVAKEVDETLKFILQITAIVLITPLKLIILLVQLMFREIKKIFKE